MNSTLERQPDGTLKVTFTIPWSDSKKAKEEVVARAVANAELPGFRKGKAPKNLVEQNIDPHKVREEVLQKLLPENYVKAITEQKINPIMNPKIHVEKIEDEKDWVITAMTCEMPEVKLNNYKDAVKKVTAKSKIIIPGKEEKKEPSLDEVVTAMMSEIAVTIPSLLTEQEVDRLLAQTLEEIKRLGLTLDQYLSSTGKTPDALRSEYAQKAENDIKLEFALQKIAEAEKLTVGDKEIQEAISKAKDPVEMKQMESNKYVLASILRQQKTLDFLKNL